ncbi:MAG TPA: DUF308 domain-containing protein [Solirubrobacteraceae bacterium]|nr:DUF308 domain-containing protein [Solirubrobacteraceae bacterium]
MEIPVTSSDATYRSPGRTGGLSGALREFTRYWWLWLVMGIAWVIAALVILQFNHASITTVSVILGLMFAVAALEQFALSALADTLRWLWVAFGVLFAACAVICFVEPAGTFTGLANVLGFLFVCVGIWWMIRAFLLKELDPTWWLGLVAGILMVVLGFWTSGQFFLQRAYTLLVFAGIWALMEGVTLIVRAFQIRGAGKAL